MWGMNKDSKINVVEGMFMLILAGSADAVEALGTAGLAIPLIGPALPIAAWFYGLIISAILLFWLIMKGVSVGWMLGGSGIELIPMINSLPARTSAMIATIIEDNLPPKAKEVVGKATKVTKLTKN